MYPSAYHLSLPAPVPTLVGKATVLNTSANISKTIVCFCCRSPSKGLNGKGMFTTLPYAIFVIKGSKLTTICCNILFKVTMSLFHNIST